jgi:hypothetical protein
VTLSAIRSRPRSELAAALAVAAFVAILIPVAREVIGLAGPAALLGVGSATPASGLFTIVATGVCLLVGLAWPPRWPWSVRAGAIAGTVVSAAILFVMSVVGLTAGGGDALVLYEHRLPDPYDAPYSAYGFVYAPPVAQAIYPFVQLPWPVFFGAWTALLVLALAAVAGPAAPIVILAPLIALDLNVGNVNIILALAVARGLTVPGSWSAVLFTKVTPAIGIGWFVATRRWHELGLALGVAGAIAAVSFVLAPGLWFDWVGTLTETSAATGSSHTVLLLVRVTIAATLVVWGARTGRPWAVGVAAFAAIPFPWPTTVSLLLAVIPLADRRSPTTAAVAEPAMAPVRWSG